MPAAYTTLRVTTENQTALITLARPERRNAISPEMIEDLLAALATIETGPERVAIITGEGKGFCAGMDLDALRKQIGQSPATCSSPGGFLTRRRPRHWAWSIASSRRRN